VTAGSRAQGGVAADRQDGVADEVAQGQVHNGREQQAKNGAEHVGCGCRDMIRKKYRVVCEMSIVEEIDVSALHKLMCQ
jgi:hypothetical protein